MSAFHVVVRGRVQGVGFRWFVRERARALGLRGWVRNQADGSVEILALGDGAALEQLRSLVWTGPPGSDVTSIDAGREPPAAEAMNPFGILR